LQSESGAAMARKPPDPLARLQRAAQRVREFETGLTDARAELREAIRAAVDAGVSMSAVARELGITRQRVKQLLDARD
jgi:hypothetical protein